MGGDECDLRNSREGGTITRDGDKRRVKIATRRSKLALIQTNKVIECLKGIDPWYDFECIKLDSTGDKIQDVALEEIGKTSVFTKESELLVLNKKANFAVHSLKDLACTPLPGLTVPTFLEREDPRDCVIMRRDLKVHKYSLKTLSPDSIIGTSSPRRISFIKRYYPHLNVKNIRGNIQTRLKKLNNIQEGYSAILLAFAAIIRLNLMDEVDEILPIDVFLPSPGQGCIAAQCREDDFSIIKFLKKINHTPTELCSTTERSFMYNIMAGCSVPIGAYAHIPPESNVLTLTGAILSRDGNEFYSASVSTTLDVPLDSPSNLVSAASLGDLLKRKIISLGAQHLIDIIRTSIGGTSIRAAQLKNALNP